MNTVNSECSLELELAELRSKYEGLRRAFREAAETYPKACPMPTPVQEWWRTFYNAILENS